MNIENNIENLDETSVEQNKNVEIINGWEYVSQINPKKPLKEQVLQNSYLSEYNLAYNTFLTSLYISKEQLDSITSDLSNRDVPETKYKYIIDTSEDNDVINADSKYPIKFLKTKFINFKIKKIRSDLINYYKPLGFFVKGPYELITNKSMNKHYIELCWNINNAPQTNVNELI